MANETLIFSGFSECSELYYKVENDGKSGYVVSRYIKPNALIDEYAIKLKKDAEDERIIKEDAERKAKAEVIKQQTDNRVKAMIAEYGEKYGSYIAYGECSCRNE